MEVRVSRLWLALLQKYHTDEVFTAIKIQVEVYWVVTPCSVAVGYHRFEGPCCPHFTLSFGGSKVLRNDDILPRNYTASECRRPRLVFPYCCSQN